MPLHEASIGKGRRIAGYILSILPTLVIIGSGINKLIGSDALKVNMEKIKMVEIMPYIGILEFIIVILYWIPKTSNIGFFLMASYCGGIIASEITMGEFPLIGIVVATLFYVGTMLRKPSLSGLGI